MEQIVTADIEVYDPAIPGTRTLRYATSGYTVGVSPTADPPIDSRVAVTRASTATRVDVNGVVQTVANNVGRIDHDPATRACLGLLREPARINLCTRSAYNALAWSNDFPSGATLTAGIDDPSGGTAAVRFAMNGTTAARLRVTTTSFSPSGSALYALSFWCRLVSGSGNPSADVQDGAPSGAYGSQLATGQWRRVVLVGTPAAGGKTVIDLVSDLTATMTLDFWGLQVEAGEWATSLIPTTGATATRAAEDVIVGTLTPWYSATEGTIIVEASMPYVAAGAMGPIRFDNGTANNLISIRNDGAGNLEGRVVNGGTVQASMASAATAISAGGVFLAALAYKANDFAFCVGGGSVLTDTSGTVPTGINRLLLGENTHGASIRRVLYYATRLTNAQIQAITGGQAAPAAAPLELNFVGNAHQHYEGRIQQAANIERTLFQGRRTTGRTQIGYGAMTLVNTDAGLDALLDYSFVGRPVSIRLGTMVPTTGRLSWATIMRGTMEQADLSWQRVTLRVRDRLLDLAKPIQQTRYAGNNALPAGLEGLATDLKGKPKPIVFGRVWNISPPQVNTDRLIYQIHSGSALQSLGEVYDRGVPLVAGAVYTSQAQMETTAPAAGQYRLWNDATAGAFIRLGSAPVGTIAVDAIRGAAVANRTVGQLFQQILLAAGIPQADISSADITALDAAVGYEVGVYAPHDRDVTPLELLDELCASVGAWYAVDALGQFRIGRVVVPTSGSVTTITSTEIIRIERVSSRDPGVGVPAWKCKVGYRKIETVQTDLGSTVTALRKAYFSDEYRRVEASDSTVRDANPLAPEIEFLTVLSNEADAAAEASRLLTLYKTRRDMYQVTVRVDAPTASLLDLGKVVTMQVPRFGMAAGKLFLIIGITTNMQGYEFDLTLWG